MVINDTLDYSGKTALVVDTSASVAAKQNRMWVWVLYEQLSTEDVIVHIPQENINEFNHLVDKARRGEGPLRKMPALGSLEETVSSPFIPYKPHLGLNISPTITANLSEYQQRKHKTISVADLKVTETALELMKHFSSGLKSIIVVSEDEDVYRMVKKYQDDGAQISFVGHRTPLPLNFCYQHCKIGLLALPDVMETLLEFDGDPAKSGQRPFLLTKKLPISAENTVEFAFGVIFAPDNISPKTPEGVSAVPAYTLDNSCHFISNGFSNFIKPRWALYTKDAPYRGHLYTNVNHRAPLLRAQLLNYINTPTQAYKLIDKLIHQLTDSIDPSWIATLRVSDLSYLRAQSALQVDELRASFSLPPLCRQNSQ